MQEKIKITLNNQFYTRKAIQDTLKQFKELCSGRILNNRFEIELSPKENIPNIEGEFYNYVLGMMKNEN
ncbi:hypothetical protein GF323_02340 [Candidatus Woesearchaeota archaeon]|nr:hypothetical protein [Candidatus Woesearchaeota archaeon]